MKRLGRSLVQLTVSIVLIMAGLAFTTHECFAVCDRIATDEQKTLTGHIVGDNVARGIDFTLKPVYRGLSGAFFFLLKPCEPTPTVTIRTQDSGHK